MCARSRLLCLLLFIYVWSAVDPSFSQTPLTPQSITLLPVANQALDAAPFQVIALASSDLPVDVTVSGPALIFRRMVTLTGTGTVTVTATQAGNGTYSPVSAQETFQVLGAKPTIGWNPQGFVYGTPLASSMLNASATATPLVDAQADISTVTSQLDTSQLTGGTQPTVDQFSPLIRYEGSTMALTTDVNGGNGLQANGSVPPLGIDYRVVFTCDCQQFEWVMQSRQSNWRLWVDGQWATVDRNFAVDAYPQKAFYLVKFPDKRPRQIKIALSGNPPFFGLITNGNDTISAPQVPLGERVIIMGDSWTGPTISPPLLPPAQIGENGAGFAEVLGEYFNWDYWVTSAGGEGFISGGGVVGESFGQRAPADICGHAADAVMVVGGGNDGDITASQLQQAAVGLYDTLATCLPGVPIYIFGPQSVNYPVSQGLIAAAQQFGSGVFYGDMAPSPNQNDPSNWIYGAYDDATVGNSYVYTGNNDGAAGHPTPLGHDFVAEKIEYALISQYPSLAPQSYTLFNPVPISGSFQYSAAAGSLLTAGQQQLTATFTPSDATDYAIATETATITVSQATTATSLQAAQPNGPSSVTLTATVAPQIAGTPTGSAIFFDGATQLASVALQGGTASYTSASLVTGAHAFKVTYAGDVNFLPSQAATTASVVQISPDFTFNLAQPNLTIASGQTGTLSLQVSPVGTFTGTLTVACSGLPQYASCALASPAGIAVSGQPVTAQLQLSTRSQAAAPQTSQTTLTLLSFSGQSVIAVAALACVPGRRRLRGFSLFLFIGSLTGGALLFGCGSSSQPPATSSSASPLPPPGAAAGTYQVKVILSETGGPQTQHSQLLSLTID